jgi:integrase
MVAKCDFTDRYLKSLKPSAPGQKRFEWDGRVPNFAVRVDDKSPPNLAFYLVTRFPGASNPAPRKIGDYPDTPLAKGRETARQWRDDIRQGIDPKEKEAARLREQERMRADTFAAAFEAFADDHLSGLRTGAAVKAAVKTHVLPALGDRPMREIKRKEILSLLRSLQKRIPIGAERVRAYLNTFFDWAINQEIIEDSPVASIKRLSKENERDRVLALWEIRAIWQACAELGAFGRAFRFMLATGQRRTEVGEMTWSEIDRKQALWSLSKDRTKADRAHEVPLSDLALSIIAECPRLGDFVFSTGRSARVQEGKPTTVAAISGWGKAKEKLDALALKKAQEIAEREGEEAPTALNEWRLHDLRRTAATYMARIGVDRLVVSKVLNHAEEGVTKRYDRHDYAAEKRRALDRWAQRLQAIVDGVDASNVVSLAARA